MLSYNGHGFCKPRMRVRAGVAQHKDLYASSQPYRTLDSLPVERGLPFLGTSLEYSKQILGELPGYFEKHKSEAIMVNRGPLGGLVLAIGGRDLVREALVAKPEELTMRWPDSVAAGLFPNGENVSLEASVPWRKVLSTVLSPEVVMRIQLPLVAEVATSTVRRCIEEGEVKMYEEVRRVAYTVACKAAVGDILSPHDLDTMFPLACDFGKGIMFPDIGPFGPYHKAMQARKQIFSLLSQRISEYLGSLDSITGGGKDCLLSLLISGLAEEGLVSSKLSIAADGELVQRLTLEVVHLVFAGTDTTSTIMASMVQELSKHPEWLERMHCEQEKLLEEYGPDLDRRVLSRSAVAVAFVQEVMRLHHAVPGIVRVATTDFVLGDILVPKDTIVHMSLSNLTQKTGSGKEEFDPQQWLSEDSSNATPNKYSMAFGAGPRGCLGSNLAMCELLSTLIVLVRHVKVVAMSGADREHKVNVLGHPTGMPATLVPR